METVVELADGRRITAAYDFPQDRWLAGLEGSERVAQGHWLHAVIRELLDAPRGVVSRDWLIDAVDRLAERDTPGGRRVMCRCCGHLTLTSYGHHDICPVCQCEDDPTTIFEPGEGGGPGPNHLSLTEGRRNFTEHGSSKPRSPS